MKLSGQTKLLRVSKREEVVKLLLKDKNSKLLQQKYGISDFEMEDIEEQVRYRRIKPNKRDRQAQAKQDTILRTIVLCTKLGQNPEQIAKLLDKKTEEIQNYLKIALEAGLIKKNELQGIDILSFQIPKAKELVG